MLISLYAYTFANLYRKNLLSTTPRNEALNALIFALKAYEFAPHRECHYEPKRKTGRFYTVTKEQLTAI
ncbi:hypothetical protein C5Z04_14505 [Phocaeicola vulgatus]|nr:hypothetical protein C5Z04_14505 [Phocaeicola vulgatus]